MNSIIFTTCFLPKPCRSPTQTTKPVPSLCCKNLGKCLRTSPLSKMLFFGSPSAWLTLLLQRHHPTSSIRVSAASVPMKKKKEKKKSWAAFENESSRWGRSCESKSSSTQRLKGPFLNCICSAQGEACPQYLEWGYPAEISYMCSHFHNLMLMSQSESSQGPRKGISKAGQENK